MLNERKVYFTVSIYLVFLSLRQVVCCEALRKVPKRHLRQRTGHASQGPGVPPALFHLCLVQHCIDSGRLLRTEG